MINHLFSNEEDTLEEISLHCCSHAKEILLYKADRDGIKIPMVRGHLADLVKTEKVLLTFVSV